MKVVAEFNTESCSVLLWLDSVCLESVDLDSILWPSLTKRFDFKKFVFTASAKLVPQ